ncbi:DNA topoisomerase IB [Candidatus Bathyarchaeota archaeon]|nr:MAG: DNA topoisomerase IB [Candidatus Bathyarchaeota archaeon]
MSRNGNGVRYVSGSGLTWTRNKVGRGFQYFNKSGNPLKAEEIEKVEKLVIPPAWSDVKICPSDDGHIQAIGYDDKGRKQYIYNSDWIAQQQQNKFDGMIRFGEVLPKLRRTVYRHMMQEELTRKRILATVVWLLENTFIRVGNKSYEKKNDSHGLTTLRGKHVEVKGNTVKFHFKGKSGVYHELDVNHPRVAKTVKKCVELPGYKIFQYVDEDKNKCTVDSQDVNEYLHAIAGEAMSAKDFRTWGGTTIAGTALYNSGISGSEEETREVVSRVIEEVADNLGNTVAVCKEYYIHPRILASYEDGTLVPYFKNIYKSSNKSPNRMSFGEYATWMLLQS